MTPRCPDDPLGGHLRDRAPREGEAEARGLRGPAPAPVSQKVSFWPPLRGHLCGEVLPDYGDKNSSCLVTFCHVALLGSFMGIMTGWNYLVALSVITCLLGVWGLG